MVYIDELERELHDLAKTVAVASREDRMSQWMLMFDEFTREVRQTMLSPMLKSEIENKILPGIEILNEVLRGMKHEEREGGVKHEYEIHKGTL